MKYYFVGRFLLMMFRGGICILIVYYAVIRNSRIANLTGHSSFPHVFGGNLFYRCRNEFGMTVANFLLRENIPLPWDEREHTL